jgi:hypothetical protein
VATAAVSQNPNCPAGAPPGADCFTVSISGLQTDGTGNGPISVTVNANSVTDDAGNKNSVSNTATTTWSAP